jgi:hypothetical protein
LVVTKERSNGSDQAGCTEDTYGEIHSEEIKRVQCKRTVAGYNEKNIAALKT